MRVNRCRVAEMRFHDLHHSTGGNGVNTFLNPFRKVPIDTPFIFCYPTIMKTRNCVMMMKRLVKVHGSDEAVAVLLRKTARYVDMLKKRQANPSEDLQDRIRAAYAETFPKEV